MGRAFKAVLTLQQQQHLLAELEKDSRIVYHIGLTPSKVSEAKLAIIYYWVSREPHRERGFNCHLASHQSTLLISCIPRITAQRGNNLTPLSL